MTRPPVNTTLFGVSPPKQQCHGKTTVCYSIVVRWNVAKNGSGKRRGPDETREIIILQIPPVKS